MDLACPTVRPVTRSTLLPPEGTHFAPLYRNGPPALSPDGTWMVFVASRDGKTSLWLRPLDKLDATELAGTDGAYFSLLVAGWTIHWILRQRQALASGYEWRLPRGICDVPDARGGTWGAGNVIVFNAETGNLIRVATAGGTSAEPIFNYRNTLQVSDRWPFFLPDGKHFVYLHSPIGAGDDRNEIRFASVDGKTNKLLLKGHYYNPEFASGRLLVGRNRTLVAQRLDPATGELSGDAVQIADKLISQYTDDCEPAYWAINRRLVDSSAT